MSSSDSRIRFEATASTDYSPGAEPVEIHLIDGDFEQVAQSVGKLETTVTPGVYKLKIKAGTSFQEIPLLVEEGSDPVVVQIPPLQFQSAAPLWNTTTSREYHQDASIELSREVHDELGSGASLFVFVRDLDGRGRVNPARGLTLATIDGSMLIDYETVADHGGRRGEESNRWAGHTVALDPGSYRLAVDTGESGVVEQLIYLTDGWQTHVFLNRRAFGDGRSGRRPDLVDAAIHMSELGMGFVPDSDGFRDGDLARKALADGRVNAVPSDALRRLLDYKFVNPMLGLYGTYLLTNQEEPLERLVHIVMGNLRNLLGVDHPDLAALEVRLAQLGMGGRPPDRIEMPPMIRRGWDAIVRHSAEHLDLVPAESLAGRIADRVWGRGPWLLWHRPPDPGESQEMLGADELRSALRYIREAESELDPSVEQRSRMTPLQSSIIELSRSPGLDADDGLDMRSTAVKALGVPPTVASKAVVDLRAIVAHGETDDDPHQKRDE